MITLSEYEYIVYPWICITCCKQEIQPLVPKLDPGNTELEQEGVEGLDEKALEVSDQKRSEKATIVG